MADFVSRIGSSGQRRHLPTLAAAISVAAFVLGMAGPAASADETSADDSRAQLVHSLYGGHEL